MSLVLPLEKKWNWKKATAIFSFFYCTTRDTCCCRLLGYWWKSICCVSVLTRAVSLHAGMWILICRLYYARSFFCFSFSRSLFFFGTPIDILFCVFWPLWRTMAVNRRRSYQLIIVVSEREKLRLLIIFNFA